jgi:hypothetical protein
MVPVREHLEGEVGEHARQSIRLFGELIRAAPTPEREVNRRLERGQGSTVQIVALEGA